VFKIGQTLTVKNLREDCELREYLLSCGFVDGATVSVLAASPLKKTVLISISDSVVSVSLKVLESVIWKK